jgi:hypothetical protein
VRLGQVVVRCEVAASQKVRQASCEKMDNGKLLAGVALIALVLDWAPHWLASTNGLNASQRADEVGRVRTALLALLAGTLAAVGAIYTARTFSLNRQTYEHTREKDRQSHELDQAR